jgi:hypothetical protein
MASAEKHLRKGARGDQVCNQSKTTGTSTTRARETYYTAGGRLLARNLELLELLERLKKYNGETHNTIYYAATRPPTKVRAVPG